MKMQRSRLLSPMAKVLGGTSVPIQRGGMAVYRLGQGDGEAADAAAKQAAKEQAASTAAGVQQLLGAIPQGSSAWFTYAGQLNNCLTMMSSESLTGLISGGVCLYSLYQTVRDYLDKQDEDEKRAREAADRAAAAAAAAAKAVADKAAAELLARQSSGGEWLWLLAGGAVATAAVVLLA